MQGHKETKDAVRRKMHARRKGLSGEERALASKLVCARLCGGGAADGAPRPFRMQGPIAVYLASPDEIDLSAFISEMLGRGVKVVAPRWNGETYELAKLGGLSSECLRRGPMGILEPAEAEVAKPGEVAVWIVPGLAFTRDGRRLGYGGGWYDRLLASASADSLRIGVAHEFQVVEELPQEPHDIRIDCVVTPTANGEWKN